jgi:hypothetical protein
MGLLYIRREAEAFLCPSLVYTLSALCDGCEVMCVICVVWSSVLLWDVFVVPWAVRRST